VLSGRTVLLLVVPPLAGLLVACNGDDRSSQPAAPPSTTPTSTADASTTSSSAVTTTTSPDNVLTATSRLRHDGIGPVRVGMTLAQASRVMGKPLRVDPDSSPHPELCGFADPPGVSVSFMVIDGRHIERVDVHEGGILTVSGVGIGASEAEVMRVYGPGLKVQPHPYDETGRYLVYESPEPSQRGLLLIFETDGAKVTSSAPACGPRWRPSRGASDQSVTGQGHKVSAP
jgi:hypothetical protein